MGLHKYAAASNGHAAELAASLTPEDVGALATELKTMGKQAWLHWLYDHEDEIQTYVCATPAYRLKKKPWQNPPHRHLLVLGAIRHCHAAHALLGFLAEKGVLLSEGGPYRDTSATAGSAFWTLKDIEIAEWPPQFEEICPSPFAT
jgi:hypothetical protein